MESTPRFTVIIPVYNRPEKVKRALDSVLNQNHLPEKVIVVDDGSTDGTPEVLKSFNNKVIVIRKSNNCGVSSARNSGIKAAVTPWIALLDSDDAWKPEKLEKDAAFILDNPKYKLFQSKEIWYRNGVRVNQKKHQIPPEGWIFERCLERCLISPSSVVLQSSLFEKYGFFDESLPVCEDYDFWIRLTRHIPCGLVDYSTVIKYRGHGGELSRKYPVMDRFRIKALEKLLEKEKDPAYISLIKRELHRKQNIVELARISNK